MEKVRPCSPILSFTFMFILLMSLLPSPAVAHASPAYITKQVTVNLPPIDKFYPPHVRGDRELGSSPGNPTYITIRTSIRMVDSHTLNVQLYMRVEESGGDRTTFEGIDVIAYDIAKLGYPGWEIVSIDSDDSSGVSLERRLASALPHREDPGQGELVDYWEIMGDGWGKEDAPWVKVYFNPVTLTIRKPQPAEIASISPDRTSYKVGDTVIISYVVKNAGDARLDLRMVVNVGAPDGRTVYDSHAKGEDKRHVLNPGESASGRFSWTIPENAPPGTYTITASLRDWNNWDKIYDYRWGDKPGPTFKVEAPPRLEVIDPRTDKSEYFADETVHFSWQVKNTGNVKVTFMPVLKFRGPNGHDFSSGARFEKVTLEPGQTITIPSAKPASQLIEASGGGIGTYKWGIILVSEDGNTQYVNTCFVREFAIKLGVPDLTVTSVHVSPSELFIGERLTVEFTLANIGKADSASGGVGIYLGKTEYGTNYLLGEPLRNAILKAGETKSFKYEVRVPENVEPGTYYVTVFVDHKNEVKESNENNNIGSTTPNKVTVHIRSFRVNHASFEVWFPELQPAPHAVYFKLDYENDLTEDVVVVFFIKDSSGNVISATNWHRLFGFSVAKAGSSGTVRAEWIARPGTFYFSWKAYLISDKNLSTPIDSSTREEEKTITLVSVEGTEITHSLYEFKNKTRRQYVVEGFLPMQAYRYSVEPKIPNSLWIGYFDDFPYILTPFYPTRLNPVRYLYVFIPDTVPIKSFSMEGKIELVKTFKTSEEYKGTWYIFKLTADEKVAWLEWRGAIKFELENPTYTSTIFVRLSTIPDIIIDEILETAIHKSYELINAELRGGAWFSPTTLLTFLISLGVDILSSHQMIILDTGIWPSFMSVQPKAWNDAIKAGESKSQTFTVSASGGTIKGVTITKLSGPDWITISPTSLGDIPTGSSKTFTVTASPPSTTPAGKYDYSIRVTCIEGEPKSIDVSGTITVSALPPPKIKIEPSHISFGNVNVGEESVKTITIYNDGGLNLEIQGIGRASGSDEFIYVPFRVPDTEPPFSIPPGGSREIAFKFKPSSAGYKSATFEVRSNDPNNPVVRVLMDGTGVGEFSFTITSAGEVKLGDRIEIQGRITPNPSPDPGTGVGTTIHYTKPNGEVDRRSTAHNPQDFSSGFTVDHFKPDMPGSWSAYAVAEWTQGGRKFSVRSNSIHFEVTGGGDVTPPNVVVTHNPSTPITTQKVKFTVTADDNPGGSGIAEITLYIDGEPVQRWTSAGTHVYEGGPYSVGEHTYYAVARDKAGNIAKAPIAKFAVNRVTVDIIFGVLDRYFAKEPCPYTDNRVPTVEDIFRLLDAYFKGG